MRSFLVEVRRFKPCFVKVSSYSYFKAPAGRLAAPADSDSFEASEPLYSKNPAAAIVDNGEAGWIGWKLIFKEKSFVEFES